MAYFSARHHTNTYSNEKNEQTKFAKAASAAFTGHRFYNFSQKELIKERLTKAILEAYKHGISNFISGFAIGIVLMQHR